MLLKKIARIILSLLGLSLGLVFVVGSLRQEVHNNVYSIIGVAFSAFCIGWLFNLRFSKILTGIFLVPIGIAGSLWTIWDFFQDILFDQGVIGNYPILGNGLTIFLVPYLIVFSIFVWLIVVGVGLVRGKAIQMDPQVNP